MVSSSGQSIKLNSEIVKSNNKQPSSKACRVKFSKCKLKHRKETISDKKSPMQSIQVALVDAIVIAVNLKLLKMRTCSQMKTHLERLSQNTIELNLREKSRHWQEPKQTQTNLPVLLSQLSLRISTNYNPNLFRRLKVNPCKKVIGIY